MIGTANWLSQQGIMDGMESDTFEQAMCAVWQTDPSHYDAEIMARISLLERAVLTPAACPSQMQQARFFFLGGGFFEQAKHLRTSNEYYSLCSRRLSAADVEAQLLLHRAWGPVAEAMQRPLTALYSYQTVVRLLRACDRSRESPSGKSSIQHYEECVANCQALLANNGSWSPRLNRPGSLYDDSVWP